MEDKIMLGMILIVAIISVAILVMMPAQITIEKPGYEPIIKPEQLTDSATGTIRFSVAKEARTS